MGRAPCRPQKAVVKQSCASLLPIAVKSRISQPRARALAASCRFYGWRGARQLYCCGVLRFNMQLISNMRVALEQGLEYPHHHLFKRKHCKAQGQKRYSRDRSEPENILQVKGD